MIFESARRAPYSVPPFCATAHCASTHSTFPAYPSFFQWWEVPPHAKGVKWHYMEHTGVYFPPAYVPHGVKILYDGVPVDLTPEQEEIATFFAAIGKEAPQLKVRAQPSLSCAPCTLSFVALL